MAGRDIVTHTNPALILLCVVLILGVVVGGIYGVVDLLKPDPSPSKEGVTSETMLPLSGRVLDSQTMQALAGVRITLFNTSLPEPPETVTDSFGQFRFSVEGRPGELVEAGFHADDYESVEHDFELGQEKIKVYLRPEPSTAPD